MTTTTHSLRLAHCFVTVDDPEAALGFYRDTLGFTVQTDVSNGDFRWLTLTTAHQPELELTLQPVGGGMPLPDADRKALDDLLAKGVLGAVIFHCDDVDALFEHVRASGAEVLQEPADQFYGVRDCAFRDPAGNLVRFKAPLPRG
jgi:catechol 2,3-dioxygenase-like lactoylglutathione lyase family enzyme